MRDLDDIIPAASTAPTYDLDGNQTSDGQWTYTWDGENRLTSATRTAAAITAGAPYRAISYSYDSQARKITRSVFTALNSPPSTLIFLYNGWNCIAEYSYSALPTPNSALQRSYLWGIDLSGSMQGAGGVGGLLSIHDVATSTTHYPCYDGNGNIRKLLHATTLATTANYDYGPFGELTRATGPYAGSNPYRFSTKPQDVDTGMLDYTNRWYRPNDGRWMSRDKIDEQGGENLYGFVANNGVNKSDRLGLDIWDWVQGDEGWFPGDQSDLINNLDRPIGDGGSHEGDWYGALYDLEDWLKGNSPAKTDYADGDPKSRAISVSPIANKLRTGYFNKFKNQKCLAWKDYTNVSLSFGVNEFIESIPNGRAHFVGSARGDAYTIESKKNSCKVKAKFVIKNTTHLKSALFHIIPNSWNNTTTGTPGANWEQTYTWHEEFNCED